MYVCLCHGISDKKIIDAQSSGVSSFSELQRSCPVGTNCGTCVPFVKKLLRQKDKSTAPLEGDPEAAAARS